MIVPDLDGRRGPTSVGRADPDAEFSAFVRARMSALLRAAYVLTGDQHLAEDLVQTALARTHLAWSRLRDTDNADAYARRVMYHLQVSSWRRRRVTEAPTDQLPDTGLDDASAQVSVRLAVRDALSQLTAKQRAVLVLRFLEDRSEAETAAALHVSVGTVKSQTNRALERMRALVPSLGLFADEVRSAELEPAIRATARAIGRRRAVAVVAGIAVTVVVAIVATAGLVLTLRPRTVGPAAPQPTVSPTGFPPGTGLPIPAYGPDDVTVAYGCPGVSTVPVAAPSMPGTLYSWRVDGPTNCVVVSRLSGGTITPVATVPAGDDGGPLNSITVSPDGTRVAWVQPNHDGTLFGWVMVARFGDPTPAVLYGGVSYVGGDGPRWAADSAHLIIVDRFGGTRRLDPILRAVRLLPRAGSYETESVNGAYQAFRSDNQLVVATKDGVVVHRLDHVADPMSECGCGFSVQGISDDGRYAVLGRGNTDPSRVADGIELIDVVTGEIVGLPVGSGSRIRQLRYGAGGQLAVLAGPDGGAGPARLHLLSPQRTVIHQADVPDLGTLAAYLG